MDRKSFGGKKTKIAEINDEWETFYVRFTVFQPSQNDHEQMLICGSKEELGSWEHPITMTRSHQKVDWFDKKYGEFVRPYECEIKFRNEKTDKINKAFRFDYEYRIERGLRQNLTIERDPNRFIEIQNPSHYDGMLSKSAL